MEDTMNHKTIEIRSVIGAALYKRYPGQSAPQECYVEIDPEAATLSASYNAEVGNAVPMDVWHHRRVRMAIPALRADAANRLLEDILSLARTAADEYTSRWDGNNTVGVWGPALDALRIAVETAEWQECHQLHMWTADEWYDAVRDDLGVRTDMTDAELGALAVRLDAESIDGDMCDGVEGTEEYLRQMREAMVVRA